MDKDGSLEISFNEWRDFLLYCPSSDIHDLIKYWRHSTVGKKEFIVIWCEIVVLQYRTVAVELLEALESCKKKFLNFFSLHESCQWYMISAWNGSMLQVGY